MVLTVCRTRIPGWLQVVLVVFFDFTKSYQKRVFYQVNGPSTNSVTDRLLRVTGNQRLKSAKLQNQAISIFLPKNPPWRSETGSLLDQISKSQKRSETGGSSLLESQNIQNIPNNKKFALCANLTLIYEIIIVVFDLSAPQAIFSFTSFLHSEMRFVKCKGF